MCCSNLLNTKNVDYVCDLEFNYPIYNYVKNDNTNYLIGINQELKFFMLKFKNDFIKLKMYNSFSNNYLDYSLTLDLNIVPKIKIDLIVKYIKKINGKINVF